MFTGNGATFRGDSEILAVAAGDAAGFTVAVAAGAMEGAALRLMVGEGRAMDGGEAIALGDGVAGGVVGRVAEGDAAATDGAIEGVAFGVGLGDGRIFAVGDGLGVARIVGVGLAAGAEVAVAVALAAGVAVTVALAAGVALGARVGLGTGVAVGATVALTVGVALAAAVAAGVAVVVSCGFTNFFGGALGGGVASALILERARSAAERSAIAVQPVSITTSETRSFTVRGRGISGTSTITGADTSSSSPRIVAGPNSTFICNCRRKRYRSIGR